MFMGSDALYVNFSGRKIYKLDVLNILNQNDFDSFEVTDHQLVDSLNFTLKYGDKSQILQVLELENKPDDWKERV